MAAVAIFHAVDYLGARSLRKKFRENADFALVDRVAHAFKHVRSGNPADPNLQPLLAEGVIERPPAYYGAAVWDLSSWNDPVGGVTLDGEREVDILSAVKHAADFVRSQIGS